MSVTVAKGILSTFPEITKYSVTASDGTDATIKHTLGNKPWAFWISPTNSAGVGCYVKSAPTATQIIVNVPNGGTADLFIVSGVDA